jgi:hypothetical protein
MQMDAVLAEMGPPPDWSDDTNDSNTGEFGSSAVDDSLKSPEGVEICRTMPGSAETQMSVGVPNPSERAVTAATTTARAGKKRTIACRKGVRVVIKRKKLKSSIAIPSPEWTAIENVHDDALYYGTCLSSSGKGVFNIQFDLLPCNHNEVSVPRRNFTTLAKDDDEPEFSHQADQETEETEAQGNLAADLDDDDEDDLLNNDDGNPTTTTVNAPGGRKKKNVNYSKKSQDDFLKLPAVTRQNAKSFQHYFGPGESDFVAWTILDDDEQIVEDMMDHPAKNVSPLKTALPWNVRKEDVPFNDNFFKGFFPSLEGKAKLMDEFFSDPRCGMESTIKNDKIQFEREGDDPEVLLKICITLLIASANEVQGGINLLWKQGAGYGFRDFPNYAKFIPKNYFKAFVHAFPFMWADRIYWYMSRNDLPWDVFQPFVNEYNKIRRLMIDVHYLVLDESMSGWRPKTTATGGLPNITFEPRKPVDLGTMIKNGCECVTGMFVYHDIVKGTVQQSSKKYCNMKSHLPRGEPILSHVAEVLRQAEGSGIKKGGWIGGDAWFGSINAAVELKCRLGLNSTFIVKQNKNYCPIDIIKSILVARYPKRPAGHWVVMKATISDVELFLMAYAWSQQGIAYIISTCGTTVRHSHDYQSKFPDGYGNIDSCAYP